MTPLVMPQICSLLPSLNSKAILQLAAVVLNAQNGLTEQWDATMQY
jgi:hypothetical protein